MVDDEVRKSAEELRGTAAKLRDLARQTQSLLARSELLDLADRFERVAARLDGDDAPPDGAKDD